MNPFLDIPLIGPIFGYFIVFLLPPLLVGGYAMVLFTGINRLPRRSARLLVAVAIAVILSLANYSYENFLRTALTDARFIALGSFSFFITAFLVLTIMASGTIVAWHLMAVHLRTERPRLMFFACFVISFLSAFLMGFNAVFGSSLPWTLPAEVSPQVTDTLIQMFRFSEMVLFGLVVMGLYHIPAGTDAEDRRYAIQLPCLYRGAIHRSLPVYAVLDRVLCPESYASFQ